jgi:hypothetical protein
MSLELVPALPPEEYNLLQLFMCFFLTVWLIRALYLVNMTIEMRRAVAKVGATAHRRGLPGLIHAPCGGQCIGRRHVCN